MAINIRKIFEIAARKAHLVDSDTSAIEMGNLLNILEKTGGGFVREYATEDDLPLTLSNSIDEKSRMAYVTGKNRLYLRNSSGWSASLPGLYQTAPQWANGQVSGYLHGGSSSGQLSVQLTATEKYSFSSYTPTAVPVGFSESRHEASAFASKEAGYIAAGYTQEPGNTFGKRTILKMPFVNETSSVLPQTFTNIPNDPVGHMSPNSVPSPGTQGFYRAASTSAIPYAKGYVFGGDNSYTPSGFAKVSYLTTSNDTLTQSVGNMQGGVQERFATTGNNETGYQIVREPPAWGGNKVELYRWIYSSDTAAAPVTSLPLGAPVIPTTYQIVPTTGDGGVNSFLNGFWGGVDTSPITVAQGKYIMKFPFASEIVAVTVGGDLTVEHRDGGSHSTITEGVWLGGGPSTPPTLVSTNVIDRFPFSSEGTVTETASLSGALQKMTAQGLQY